MEDIDFTEAADRLPKWIETASLLKRLFYDMQPWFVGPQAIRETQENYDRYIESGGPRWIAADNAWYDPGTGNYYATKPSWPRKPGDKLPEPLTKVGYGTSGMRDVEVNRTQPTALRQRYTRRNPPPDPQNWFYSSEDDTYYPQARRATPAKAPERTITETPVYVQPRPPPASQPRPPPASAPSPAPLRPRPVIVKPALVPLQRTHKTFQQVAPRLYARLGPAMKALLSQQ